MNTLLAVEDVLMGATYAYRSLDDGRTRDVFCADLWAALERAAFDAMQRPHEAEPVAIRAGRATFGREQILALLEAQAIRVAAQGR